MDTPSTSGVSNDVTQTVGAGPGTEKGSDSPQVPTDAPDLGGHRSTRRKGRERHTLD